MASIETLPFGSQLRCHRVAAGLTQEELAARAGVSVRAISDLERGVVRRAHLETVALLAEALPLAPADRVVFERAARPRGATPLVVSAIGRSVAPPTMHRPNASTAQLLSGLQTPLAPLGGQEQDQAALALLLGQALLRALATCVEGWELGVAAGPYGDMDPAAKRKLAEGHSTLR